MNFLAHAYLSGSDKKILAGNFLADAVKGKQYESFEKGLQKGILLHRSIDDFTDSHIINVEVRDWLRPTGGKFSGVVLDMVYDYCLANAGIIPNLEAYTLDIYQVLDNYEHLFKGRLKRMYPYMSTQNWLLHYKRKEAVIQAVKGVGVRFSSEVDLEPCARFALQNEKVLFEYFNSFFSELQQHCKQEIERLNEEVK